MRYDLKYVISYDISDDRRRTAASRILLGFGYRVQKSVFEGFASKDYLAELEKRLEDIIDPKEDSIRIYRICADCTGEIKILGNGRIIEKVNYIII